MKKVFTYSLEEAIGNKVKDEGYSLRKSSSQLVQEILDGYFKGRSLSEFDPVIVHVLPSIKRDKDVLVKSTKKKQKKLTNSVDFSEEELKKVPEIEFRWKKPNGKETVKTISKDNTLVKKKSLFDQMDEVRDVPLERIKKDVNK